LLWYAYIQGKTDIELAMTISVQDLLKLSTSEKASALTALNGNELLELALAIKNQFSQEDIKLKLDEDKIKKIPNVALRDIIFNDLEYLDIKNKMPNLLKLIGFEDTDYIQPSFEKAIQARYEVDHRGVSKPKASPTYKTEEIITLIRKLHGQGLSLETQDSIGLSLLHKLVYIDGLGNFDYDRIRVAKTLIELAPNILNLKWNDKDNPLEWAVRHNDPELLEALIPHYAGTKSQYRVYNHICEDSLLHHAEVMGYTELADILKKNGFEYTKLEEAISKNTPLPYDETLTPLENENRIKHNEKLNYYDFTPQKPKDAKPFLMSHIDNTILTSDGRKFQSDSMIGFIREHFDPSFFSSSRERRPHLLGKDIWFPKFVNRCFDVNDIVKDQLQYSKVTGSFLTEKGEFKIGTDISSEIAELTLKTLNSLQFSRDIFWGDLSPSDANYLTESMDEYAKNAVSNMNYSHTTLYKLVLYRYLNKEKVDELVDSKFLDAIDFLINDPNGPKVLKFMLDLDLHLGILAPRWDMETRKYKTPLLVEKEIQSGNIEVLKVFLQNKRFFTQEDSKELSKLIDKKHKNSLEMRQLIRDKRKQAQLLEEAKAKAWLKAKKDAKDIVSKYYKGGNLQTDNVPPEVQRLFVEIGISTKDGFDKNIKDAANHRTHYIRDVDMGYSFMHDMFLRIAWLPDNLKVFALKAKAFFTLKTPLELAIPKELVSKLMDASEKLSKDKTKQEAEKKFTEYKTKQLQRLNR
jgi:ankyrin repeat protein